MRMPSSRDDVHVIDAHTGAIVPLRQRNRAALWESALVAAVIGALAALGTTAMVTRSSAADREAAATRADADRRAAVYADFMAAAAAVPDAYRVNNIAPEEDDEDRAQRVLNARSGLSAERSQLGIASRQVRDAADALLEVLPNAPHPLTEITICLPEDSACEPADPVTTIEIYRLDSERYSEHLRQLEDAMCRDLIAADDC